MAIAMAMAMAMAISMVMPMTMRSTKTTKRKSRRSVPAAFLLMVVAVSSTIFLVAAAPLLEDEKENGRDDNGSSATSLGGIETILMAGGTSIPVSGASSSSSSSALALASSTTTTKTTNDCIDDPNFFYEGKKACTWLSKRTKKRCKIVYGGKPLADRCRETCDYEKCRTNLEQKNKLLVGAYYYPWYGQDFHRGSKNHSYLRSKLSNPRQFPVLGEYDDTQPEVIARHLKWSRQNNIKLWVTSWWGEGRRTDVTIKNHILTNPQLKDHKIAIFYETTGRIREKADYDLKEVRPDLEYLCKQYFNHPNYYQKVDDSDGKKRPVLFVYLTRKLEDLGLLQEVVSLMRQGAKDGGCGDIFIVGDQVFQGPPSNNNPTHLIPFEILDAVTNYDVYGSLRGNKAGGYVGSRQKVTNYYQGEQRAWKNIAQSKDCAFIPSASPGFNDRGVRPEVGHIPLSRKLYPKAKEGSLFKAALQEGRTLVDSAMDNLIMINSFNEWHEDTQIEPIYAFNGSKGKNSRTSLPHNLTFGLEYQAYNTIYLKILKRQTKTWDVSLAVPASAETSLSFWDGGFGTNSTASTREEYITTISDIIGQEQTEQE
mmetsp:Transcript_5323/g.11732  ORF Transcript_5323/g.11732 Transcript_5323/m.11732 type:complete len:596 (-) Transcript_5323:1072-2859(-)